MRMSNAKLAVICLAAFVAATGAEASYNWQPGPSGGFSWLDLAIIGAFAATVGWGVALSGSSYYDV